MVTSPVTLVSIMVRHCSRSASKAGAVPSARPALLTSTSTPRNRSGRAASAASMVPASRMSKTEAWTRSAPSSCLSLSRRSARRPVMMTFHPAFEKRRAVTSPKPAVAPVTSTVLVIFSPIIRFFVFSVSLVLFSLGTRSLLVKVEPFSSAEIAAGDRQDRAGDVGGLVGRQEEDRSRLLLQRAVTLQEAR